MIQQFYSWISVQFSRSLMFDSVAPWTAARQASLSITNSWSLLKLMSIELVMPSLTPWYPQLLGIYLEKNRNTNSKRYMHPSVHSINIYNSQDIKATQAPVTR